MKIVKMVPSKKVPERYYINLDDGSELTVNIAIIADYSLFTGREFSDDEWNGVKEASSLYLAKSKAIKLMGTRSMSKRELENKLTVKGISRDSAEKAVDWMESMGAVNDEEYASMIVRHYQAKGYGIGRIKSELSRRGIDRWLWDDALSNMTDSDDTLDRLVRMRLSSRGADRNEIKKLSDSLARRGFGWEEIKRAIDRYLFDTGEIY